MQDAIEKTSGSVPVGLSLGMTGVCWIKCGLVVIGTYLKNITGPLIHITNIVVDLILIRFQLDIKEPLIVKMRIRENVIYL